MLQDLDFVLWAIARMHRDVRGVTAKRGIAESDNRMLDEGLQALSEEIRDVRAQPNQRESLAETDQVRPRAAAKG